MSKDRKKNILIGVLSVAFLSVLVIFGVHLKMDIQKEADVNNELDWVEMGLQALHQTLAERNNSLTNDQLVFSADSLEYANGMLCYCGKRFEELDYYNGDNISYVKSLDRILLLLHSALVQQEFALKVPKEELPETAAK